jgi:hypothetical protein
MCQAIRKLKENIRFKTTTECDSSYVQIIWIKSIKIRPIIENRLTHNRIYYEYS